MANTLNLGTDGNWAVKKDSLLGYNSENGNFKPLAFNFDRATSATVINKEGLIETVGSGEPRIDYLNDSKGALKLEPSRSNIITQSEAFDNSYWTKSGTSVVGGFISPSGDTSAFKLTENSANSTHIIYSPNSTVSNGATLTTSIFVKSDGRDWFLLQESTTDYGYYFNNGQVGSAFGSPLSYKIDKLANGWYKYSITTVTPNTNGRLKLQLAESDGVISYQGDGTRGIYIYGAQLEQGSYATSYIPTSGGVVTRVAETCSQTVPSGIIGQTEGTVFAEVDVKSGYDTNNLMVTLSDGTNLKQIYINRSNGKLEFFVGTNINEMVYVAPSVLTNGVHKLALAYKQDDFAVAIDGVIAYTDNNGNVPTCNKINVGSHYNENLPFNDRINDVKLYNTRLSNAELQALTKI